jgi:hypothetical protein
MFQPAYFRREETPAVRIDIEGLTRADSRENESFEPPCRVLVHNDEALTSYPS